MFVLIPGYIFLQVFTNCWGRKKDCSNHEVPCRLWNSLYCTKSWCTSPGGRGSCSDWKRCANGIS